jgi:DNA mismatch endonuclease (patch repair protein)
MVFSSKRVILLVHGCFWHGHAGCPRHRIPKSRVEWWTAKINRNMERDAEVRAALTAAGWTVLVLWECEAEIATKLQDMVRLIKAAPCYPRRRSTPPSVSKD